MLNPPGLHVHSPLLLLANLDLLVEREEQDVKESNPFVNIEESGNAAKGGNRWCQILKPIGTLCEANSQAKFPVGNNNFWIEISIYPIHTGIDR
jgi:hypothetical protein